jgi:hypothetical protein
VVTTKSDSANGNWVYIGHTPNDRADPQASDDGQGNDQPILNPITGQMEWNGTSIVEISDPSKPRLVWHIPNDQAHVNSRSVSVVYDYGFGSEPTGHDYLIRSYDTGKVFKFQIFDITTRDTDPSKIALVSEITGTPPATAVPGARHRSSTGAQRLVVATLGSVLFELRRAGFRGLTVIHIWDLKDPAASPVRRTRGVTRASATGQPGYQSEYAHHPIVDEPNNRLYIGFRGRGLAGRLGHLQPGVAETGVDDRHQPARSRPTYGVADHVRPGAELQGPRRPAAHVCLHHRRSRGRRRHEAVRERHSAPRPTWWTSPTRRTRSRCRPGRCRWATSARRAAGSGRTSTPRR